MGSIRPCEAPSSGNFQILSLRVITDHQEGEIGRNFYPAKCTLPSNHRVLPSFLGCEMGVIFTAHRAAGACHKAVGTGVPMSGPHACPTNSSK